MEGQTVAEAISGIGIYVDQASGKLPMPEMHDHPFHEIYFLQKGERDYFIGDRFYRVTAGDTVIIPPGVLHRTAGGMAHRILVHLAPDYGERCFSPLLRESLSCLGSVAVLRPTGENAQRLSSIYQSLLACYNRQVGAGNEEARLAAYAFELLFLLSDRGQRDEQTEQPPGRMEEIVRYIHENYAAIHSIGELADGFFLSKYHLCHLFTKHLGISIVSYINMIRVRAACRRLDAGERNVTAVAFSVGFNSCAYFCKVFKEQMHITPLEYANVQRERRLSGAR